MKSDVKNWYEKSYQEAGFKAQRRYPNEELLRFFGHYFFDRTEYKDRQGIKVLELGCGSCANLWMIAKEGFRAYGLDISAESLRLGRKMLDKWQTDATLTVGSFLALPYQACQFDVVIDVFSMNCVNHDDFLLALDEVYRVIKPGGLFFSYTPSQRSDAFKNYQPAEKIDFHTLNGIYRRSSPFFGNYYPFHFWHQKDYQQALITRGLTVQHLEFVQKSYNKDQELFTHLIAYAKK